MSRQRITVDDLTRIYGATWVAVRDDGALYHGRIPCEDDDGFSPHISAQAHGRNTRGPRVLFRLPTLPGEWESV